MNQLTNEEIARVFALYWDCNMIDRPSPNIEGGGPINVALFEYMYAMDKEGFVFTHKLLLTPLSAIIDEDAIEVVKMKSDSYLNITIKDKGYNAFKYGFDFKTKSIYKKKYGIVWFAKLDSLQLQYLIQRGYAVPLFIAPGHPLNGKTALEIGLAIHKTREVINGQ